MTLDFGAEKEKEAWNFVGKNSIWQSFLLVVKLKLLVKVKVWNVEKHDVSLF